jgi:hypothetical protein
MWQIELPRFMIKANSFRVGENDKLRRLKVGSSHARSLHFRTASSCLSSEHATNRSASPFERGNTPLE